MVDGEMECVDLRTAIFIIVFVCVCPCGSVSAFVPYEAITGNYGASCVLWKVDGEVQHRDAVAAESGAGSVSVGAGDSEGDFAKKG